MLLVPTGDIGRRVRQVRLSVKPVAPKQQWLAEQLGVSQAVVSNWERGRHDPSPHHVSKIAQVLGVDPGFLTGGSTVRATLGSPTIPVGFPMARIRHAGTVPAGDWGDPLASEDFVEVDVRFDHPRRFAATVVGDSCWPALRQGDLTVWHSDPAPPYNLIVLAQRVGDHGCTVKELVWDPGANRPVLAPVNPAYGQTDDGDGWAVTARLVAVVRRQDGVEQTWYSPEGLRVKYLAGAEAAKDPDGAASLLLQAIGDSWDVKYTEEGKAANEAIIDHVELPSGVEAHILGRQVPNDLPEGVLGIERKAPEDPLGKFYVSHK
jgi:transcriptional regulator with XRE-family HTH domain